MPTPPPNPATPGTPGGTPATQQIPTYHQPPFDPRMTAHSYPLGTGTNEYTRGFLQWDTSQGTPGGSYDPKDPAYVWFLYNPSTISTSYQMADGQAQGALNYSNTQGATNSSGLLIPIQQQTSFTIMFDRTYEMNDIGTLSNGNIGTQLTNWGVEVDIAALRQYTGMFASVYPGNADFNPFQSASAAAGGAAAPTAQAQAYTKSVSAANDLFGATSQGIMQLTIGYVHFGGVGAAPGSTTFASWGISYYGYIDSWSVEYTHFTQRMVPMRAVVDISFTLLPPPAAAPDATAAAKIGASQVYLQQVGLGAIVTPTNPNPPGTAGR
jgi:hypothetical protein